MCFDRLERKKPYDFSLHPQGISFVCTLKGIKSDKLLNLSFITVHPEPV